MAQYPPPQYPPQYPPPAPSTSGAAIVSLIFSLLGLLGFLPFIGSIVGIIAGNSAKSDIRNRLGQVTGEGLAQAGVILGWLGLGLWALVACSVVAMMLLGVGLPLGLGACAVLGEQTSMLPLVPAAGMVLASVLFMFKN